VNDWQHKEKDMTADIRNQAATDASKLGAGFIRWGTAFFIFGLVIGYGPLGHYIKGAGDDVGPTFLKNMTLWWGCPWTLAAYFEQMGGLGMVAIGISLLTFARDGRVGELGAGVRQSLGLCMFGLIAEFLAGYPGYFVVHHFWPNFYYAPIAAGKNVWLAMQGVSIAFYVAGAICIFGTIRRASHRYGVIETVRTAA
jgi:hypothetical protein